MDEKKIRVLTAKIGLDGHDRGIKIISQALKDAGMEVIYTGIRQTPEQVVETALQEDVDVIGISILSGAHLHLLPMVTDLLKKHNAEDILVVAGGVIPSEDIPPLKEAGIAQVFLPGTPLSDIAEFITQNTRRL